MIVCSVRSDRHASGAVLLVGKGGERKGSLRTPRTSSPLAEPLAGAGPGTPGAPGPGWLPEPNPGAPG